MLSARAYSFHQKSKLAISLSWVAGFANIVMFLACGTLVSHVTGNASYFGARVVQGDFGGVAHFGFLLGAFFLGAVASAVMTEGARRRGLRSKYILPMAVEGICLGLLAIGLAWVAGGWKLSWWSFHTLTGVACFAMGLQNATVTEISGAVVRTTHLTGVLTDLGLEGIRFLYWYRDRTRGHGIGRRTARVLRVSCRHPTVLRLLLLLSIFGSFLFGTAAGTVLYRFMPAGAMLAPLAFVMWIILADWWQPIADVRELDPLSDPELNLHGLVKSLLPAEVGLYRVAFHPARRHAAPDFQRWVELLPESWRVVILAISPLTQFDDNSAMDLGDAAARLRAQGRRLVVAGITPQQYRAFQSAGLVSLLGSENFCPDIEFAVARAINLMRGQ